MLPKLKLSLDRGPQAPGGRARALRRTRNRHASMIPPGKSQTVQATGRQSVTPGSSDQVRLLYATHRHHPLRATTRWAWPTPAEGQGGHGSHGHWPGWAPSPSPGGAEANIKRER
jgi:hypothetical protein